MDPRSNPYAPGAGFPPPELAGRDNLVERAAIAVDRIRAGRPARSLILYGLRGVGKTVLLNKIRLGAEARGFASVIGAALRRIHATNPAFDGRRCSLIWF
ncbi:MAG: ATP-binding protein [Rhodospirillales bacterium]|nr:ATP-binding protein [Rhodospirillales bacterium]